MKKSAGTHIDRVRAALLTIKQVADRLTVSAGCSGRGASVVKDRRRSSWFCVASGRT